MKYNRVIVTIILLWSLLPVHSGIKIGNLYYNLDLDDKTAEVTYKDVYHEELSWGVSCIYNKDWDITTVSIPSSVSYEGVSYYVTGIGESAFNRCKKLKSVTIPNSVTEIGDFAFAYCINLKSVTIPNSVTEIGAQAFTNCINLKSVTLPNSITSIEGVTFEGCESLRRITIPNSVTSIGEGSFMNCINLRTVSIPNSVTDIGDFAFANCINLKSVTIPNSVTEIGSGVFSNCKSLTRATIASNSVLYGAEPENYIFDKCNRLEKIYYPKGLNIQNLAGFSSAELIAYDDNPPLQSSLLSSWIEKRVVVILILFITIILGGCLWLLILFFRKRKSAHSLTQQCPHCGNRIAADSIYCECCGTKLTKAVNRKKLLWAILTALITLCVVGGIVYWMNLRRDFTETAYGINMKMIWVEGGDFLMGCTSEQSDCYDDEQNVRRVTVDGFYIGMLEVTQSQWEKVMGTSVYQQRDKADTSWPMRGVGSDNPMYYVSWEEATEFCRLLSNKTGKTYTLPTEAQWEYAARGGKKNEGTKYAGSNSIDAVAWYRYNSGESTHPCGTKRANALGIYDMSGNVWEWCKDWYSSYMSYDTNNPTGPSSGSYRVYRGGSWYDGAGYCRVTNRNHYSPGNRGYNLGFRVVCIPKND